MAGGLCGFIPWEVAMNDGHPRFWLEFAGRVGPPILAATLVACLLSKRFEPTPILLLGVGLLLIGLSHWRTFHRP
jgi:hypothetical protein